MYMTQEADYAVRIVHCLSATNERQLAKQLAEQASVSERFALKILRKLVEGDVVKSFKGKNGGYELARLPKDITLREVIETVDGPYALCRCLAGKHECSMAQPHECSFRKIYADISDTITQKLDAVTFDTLLEN